ncbi:MAG: hypothetical protein LBR79_03250 [Oscillospiraceae bacterium]|nr:hypothetical protein [Oscillospiraceae bacterium]
MISSFPPPQAWGKKEGILTVLKHDQILMQSHFLSDAFFDSLCSIKFTDRSILKSFHYNYTTKLQHFKERQIFKYE